MATLATFRSHISSILGTDATASGTEEALIDDYCNEAVKKILTETHCYVVAATPTTPNTADYTIPSTLGIVDAYFTSGGQDYPSLEPVSVDELLRLRRVQGAAPASKYACPSANLIMFWPTPASTDTFNYYHVPVPTVMSSGTHDPSVSTYGGVPAEWHDLVEFYALFRMADYDDDSSSQMGERYRGLYEAGLRKMKRALRARAGQRMPPARVNRRRRNAFSRPDTTGV